MSDIRNRPAASPLALLDFAQAIGLRTLDSAEHLFYMNARIARAWVTGSTERLKSSLDPLSQLDQAGWAGPFDMMQRMAEAGRDALQRSVHDAQGAARRAVGSAQDAMHGAGTHSTVGNAGRQALPQATAMERSAWTDQRATPASVPAAEPASPELGDAPASKPEPLSEAGSEPQAASQAPEAAEPSATSDVAAVPDSLPVLPVATEPQAPATHLPAPPAAQQPLGQAVHEAVEQAAQPAAEPEPAKFARPRARGTRASVRRPSSASS